jgi:hypothetical protein
MVTFVIYIYISSTEHVELVHLSFFFFRHSIAVCYGTSKNTLNNNNVDKILTLLTNKKKREWKKNWNTRIKDDIK